jgi:uncharacterized membrane protein YcaP (DUF421 family)
MKEFYDLIGEDRGEASISPVQMGIRAFLIFIIALILIRFTGRRSFGMRSSFDNVITILLGAVLSRSVLGNGHFFSPIVASIVIVAFHRLFAWISVHSDTFGILIKGKPKVLYQDGKFFPRNMLSSFISKKDFEEGMRKENVSSPEKIKSAYMERDGTISIVKE